MKLCLATAIHNFKRLKLQSSEICVYVIYIRLVIQNNKIVSDKTLPSLKIVYNRNKSELFIYMFIALEKCQLPFVHTVFKLKLEAS